SGRGSATARGGPLGASRSRLDSRGSAVQGTGGSVAVAYHAVESLMAFDDLPLDRPADPTPPHTPPEPEGGSLLRWAIVGLVGIAAGGLLTFWWMSRSQPVTTAPPSTTAREVAASPASRPVRQPLNLPSLGDSDPFLRELVSTLSQHPTLARLLATPNLVRSAALGVIQI